MNSRQIVITAFITAGFLFFTAWLFTPPKLVEVNDLMSRRQFISTQLIPAHSLAEYFGIPPSISIAIAAMTSEFGENELISGSNAYFLIQCDDNGPYKTGRFAQDTVFVGSIPIRGYQLIGMAYRDWAATLMSQDFYPLVKGQPAEKWFFYLNKWGYGIEDFYNNYPEIKEIDSLYYNNTTAHDLQQFE